MTISFLDAPTPIQHADRLADAIGLDRTRFWIKRDDLIGLGGGGNKVRKLQYSVAEALRLGADVLVTTGAPQSNHARLTAAAAARVGLDAVLVLSGDPVDAVGNVLLDRLFGATIAWSGSVDPQVRADQVVAELAREGKRPFLIPFGGSSSSSAKGYADAAREVREQVGDVDHLIVAVGSGGTMAGLVSGMGPERVLGVHCGAVSDPRGTVSALLDGMAAGSVAPEQLRLDLAQVGEGYEHLTPAALDAIMLFARTEGIILDPTYTGRAAAGLIAAVETGEISPQDRVVFLHSGGLPSVFANDGLARAAAHPA